MIDTLPPLRDVMMRHDLMPKKSLGQNFILDLNLTSKIALSAGSLKGHHVVEIGPGPGGLSRAILAAGAKHLTVIEHDRRCLSALKEIQDHYPDRLTIIEGDALEIEYNNLLPIGGKARLIANLPYNIATPLLTGWLKSEPWPTWYSSMTLMFQREVAERIVAKPTEKHYGRLAIIAGWRCYSSILFDISPKAFTPPPKVTSSVVYLKPIEKPLACEAKALERVTAAAFQQRRKMLRASLKSVFQNPIDMLNMLNIEPTARAETLSVEDFILLANQL